MLPVLVCMPPDGNGIGGAIRGKVNVLLAIMMIELNALLFINGNIVDFDCRWFYSSWI